MNVSLVSWTGFSSVSGEASAEAVPLFLSPSAFEQSGGSAHKTRGSAAVTWKASSSTRRDSSAVIISTLCDEISKGASQPSSFRTSSTFLLSRTSSVTRSSVVRNRSSSATDTLVQSRILQHHPLPNQFHAV